MRSRPGRPLRWPLLVLLTALVVLAVTVGALVVMRTTPHAPANSLTAACSNRPGDAAAIQSAIDTSSPGDEVVIDGPCLITSTISLIGNRTYRGNGTGTVLTEAPGRNLAAAVASDSWLDNTSYTGQPIALRNLTIDADAAANPSGGDGVVIRSWNTTIENLHITNARGNGLRVTSSSRNGTPLTGTQVNGLIRNVFVSDSGRNGIYVQDSGNAVTDWNLVENWVAGSGMDGIRMENAAGWTVERNHVYGNAGSGIRAERLLGTSISDNYVEDFGGQGNGIGVTAQGDAASTISGNRIFQFSGAGTVFLAVDNVNYGSALVAVTGNTIRGNGRGTGISLQGGSGQLTVASTGNAVSGVATAVSVGSGVSVDSGR